MTERTALIAGAGIGGLTAALCLARAGWQVDVLEKAPRIDEAGAGIQLSPNGTRVLFDLGLQAALLRVASTPQETHMRGYRHGEMIARHALGATAIERHGSPYFHLHRADLIAVLANAAHAQDSIRIHTDSPVQSVGQDDRTVQVTAAGRQYRAGLLVGADGIHSMVASHLFGQRRARFTGNIAWRALIPAQRLTSKQAAPVTSVWLGPGRHFVSYPVRGGELLNCVAVVESSAGAPGALESWLERADHTELAADFTGWHSDVSALIEAMDRDACFKWALYDRPVMPQWSRGRISLLGDACHPSLPFLAQGAAMAIEDAAVLANAMAACLAGRAKGGESVATGLQSYEAARRPRTARVQAASRRNARVFHAAGIAAWVRDRILPRASSSMFHWLYSFDALTDQRRPPDL